MRLTQVLLVALATAACRAESNAIPPSTQNATAPGTTPKSPASAAETTARQEAELAEAERALAADPTNEEKLIWVGRRLGYLGRFEEAQEVYTRGLLLHPRSAKLLRHRGHRWITLRRFERAVADLSRAWELAREAPDEVEPDGQPNAAGIPIGSLHSNVIYHLALAHYLRGEWPEAAAVWDAGRESNSANDDRLCSSTYWNVLALRRTGDAGDAARAKDLLARVQRPLVIHENESYRELCRMLGGELSPEDVLRGIEPGTTEFATRAYGVGCFRLLAGDVAAARELFQSIVDAGPRNAFGTIAAEVELAR